MGARYFVDATGAYLGGFEVPDGAEPNWPADAIEVAEPPPDGRMLWQDGAWVGPNASADDVRAEAQRRIVARTGARSLEHCMLQQLNALMRATELTNKRALGIELNPAEAAEAAWLEQLAADIKAIRAASNTMEGEPPADYAADIHWPI